MDVAGRPPRDALRVQRAVGRALGPLWLPLCGLLMRFGMGWQIEGTQAVRRTYRTLRADRRTPLLVCANHLTLVDSFLVGWALGSPGFYLRDWDALPWNTPERANFARRAWQRAAIYVLKCIPIARGGDRAEVALALDRVRSLLLRGEVALIFPEAGRSRSGRVQVESAAWGVGRLVSSLPECRVLVVYLRGERQTSWSALPAWGERFHVRAEVIEPKTDLRGLRASVDLARRIVARLAELEGRHFDDRQ